MNPHGVPRNLKPFQPGQSGNPSGRPKGSVSMKAILRRKLAEAEAASAEAIVDALIAEAKGGNLRAIAVILDRLEGKVPDKVEVRNTPPEIDSEVMAVAEAKLRQWREKMAAELATVMPPSIK